MGMCELSFSSGSERLLTPKAPFFFGASVLDHIAWFWNQQHSRHVLGLDNVGRGMMWFGCPAALQHVR